MNERINELLSGLSPELREKAGSIKTQEELMEFLSDNDIELPEDALEAVSGGCYAKKEYEDGTIFRYRCPDCGGDLEYHDNVYMEKGIKGISTRAHCVKTRVLYICQYGCEMSDPWIRY